MDAASPGSCEVEIATNFLFGRYYPSLREALALNNMLAYVMFKALLLASLQMHILDLPPQIRCWRGRCATPPVARRRMTFLCLTSQRQMHGLDLASSIAEMSIPTALRFERRSGVVIASHLETLLSPERLRPVITVVRAPAYARKIPPHRSSVAFSRVETSRQCEDRSPRVPTQCFQKMTGVWGRQALLRS